MDVIPAIDIRDGKCVRLLQGSEQKVTEYSGDPVAVARTWVEQGAGRLHIVNLDGAFGRVSRNLDIVQMIIRSVGGVIQLGGGLRSKADVELALSIGCSKVVLGTAAVENPELVGSIIAQYGHDRLLVAIDVLEGMVVARGWKSVSNVRVEKFARSMQLLGVTEVVHTDVARDGMMTGPDLSGVKMLADMGLHVIASGGIASHKDVLALSMMRNARISGVIIGKALYEKRINLPQLLREVSAC